MSSWLRISRDFCGLSAEPIPKDGHTPSIEPLGDTDAHQHVKRRAGALKVAFIIELLDWFLCRVAVGKVVGELQLADVAIDGLVLRKGR